MGPGAGRGQGEGGPGRRLPTAGQSAQRAQPSAARSLGAYPGEPKSEPDEGGVSSFTHKSPKLEHRLSLKSCKDSRDAVHAMERDSGIERDELLTCGEGCLSSVPPAGGRRWERARAARCAPSGRPGDASQLISAAHPPDWFQSRSLFFCGWAPVSVRLHPWLCWVRCAGWASQERVWTWW